MGLITWLRGDYVVDDGVADSAVELRDFSIGDPALAAYFNVGASAWAGVAVNETSALGLTALFRCVSLIAGSIAGLPLKSYRELPEGTRERVKSIFDDPAGSSGLTKFEWTELVVAHLLLHGNAFLLHEYGGAGQLAGLLPVHPSVVTVKRPETNLEKEAFGKWGRLYVVSMADGSERKFSPEDFTHIPALSMDGLRGISPVEAHRQAISCGLAGDKAAARMFGSGMMLSGVVSADEDLAEEDAQTIIDSLKSKGAGTDHAGDVAFINAAVKFTPWAAPAKDAQFIESRVHQVEEVCRIFGVPPHLVGQTEKQTSWGTGVAEQNRGLHRYVLMAWTSRIEQRLTRLLPQPRFVEFDYAGFLQPAPEIEIPLLIQQVQAGLLTVDEARAIRNLPPLGAPAPAPDGEAPP